MILYHYTSEVGYRAILKTRRLAPSLKANNPKDARYGDGQYLSDIIPGTKRASQLSYLFLGIPYQGRKFTHYLGIQVRDLHVLKGREHVYVVLNSVALDVSERIAFHGLN